MAHYLTFLVREVMAMQHSEAMIRETGGYLDGYNKRFKIWHKWLEEHGITQEQELAPVQMPNGRYSISYRYTFPTDEALMLFKLTWMV